MGWQRSIWREIKQGVYVYNLKVTNEQGLSSDKTETMFLLK